MSEIYRIKVNDDIVNDIFSFGDKRYAPLKGFLREKDFVSVLNEMRLADGSIWPIPIVLDIGEDEKDNITNAEKIMLVDGEGNSIAYLLNPEVYGYSKEDFANKVFKTLDSSHPGVKEIYGMSEFLLGGDVELIKDVKDWLKDYQTPEETIRIFQNNGWNKIVAFQTRNAPHCSHEHIQKLALKDVDGLFIQPVIGRKKTGDFTDDAILESYKIAIDNYYPADRVHLGILPLKMRYAGPREALFHALIRKNFGCTHFIVGRDHAGVAGYYAPYEAQNIFNCFTENELGIKIMKFENAFYCHDCAGHVTADSCGHSEDSRLLISGTKLRQMIRDGEKIPEQFIRPEVVKYLINHINPFVE